MCQKCFCRIISNPRQLRFHDLRIYLQEDPRCGVCNWCRAVRGEWNPKIEKFCLSTHMHHEEYDESDPTKHAIEICANCHAGTGAIFLQFGDEY